jgi:branched-chain amino acid transport system ATP-binding protein
VTVRFGGLTAVNDAGLQVGAGEIVGLIGPNGAGKTTLFNAVLGLNDPASGVVRLYDQDVSAWPAHERAALGLGRTFQVLQLFPDLDVFDNLLVATHLQNETGVLGSITASPKARGNERAARLRVRAVLELMGLTAHAYRRVGDLPFGVLRLVEIARTLVTGAPMICLDEPASGLDSTETEELIATLKMLREIGLTILVIEHDVDMVTRLCDHIYVLDRGEPLAHGTPTEIHANEAVRASYLGNPAGTAVPDQAQPEVMAL